MAESRSLRSIRRVRLVVLVALRGAGCALLLLALYRVVGLALGVPEGLTADRPLLPHAERNYEAVRPAAVGLLLLALAAWTARYAVSSSHAPASAAYRVAVLLRVAAIVALVAATWTVSGDLRQGWQQWEYARAGGSPTTPAQYRNPRDAVGAAATALRRLTPGLALLALGAALLAAQRPLVRLLAPELTGCPRCGYDADTSEQERCPECGLEFHPRPAG